MKNKKFGLTFIDGITQRDTYFKDPKYLANTIEDYITKAKKLPVVMKMAQ